MAKNICVYASSSSSLASIYNEAAKELGEKMALKGYALVFGGGQVGLMGQTARGIHSKKGQVIGVIPERLFKKGIVYEECDELIVTSEMRGRKATMEEKADAFIALPGGFGTFEELLEIITLKQLKYHNKPIVILNIDNFYEDLLRAFEKLLNLNFAKEESRKLFYVAKSIDEALEYIQNYDAENLDSKMF